MGVSVLVRMPSDIGDYFAEAHKRYLPPFQEVTEDNMVSKPMLEVVVSQGLPSIHHTRNYTKVYLSEECNAVRAAADATIVTSRFLERALNQQSIYSVHGCGVSYEGKSILFIGETGAGKTTTGLYACLSDPELGFIGGNRLFLNGDNKIIGGVRSISVRTGSLTTEFSMFPHVKEVAAFKGINCELSSKKVLMDPTDFHITTEPVYPSEISAILIVKKIPTPLLVTRIDTTQVEDYSIKEYRSNYDEFFKVLYESAAEFSEHFPLVLPGAQLPHPEIFSYGMKLRRAEFVRTLAAKSSVSHVEGNLKDIGEFAIRLLRAGN